ncbi:deoxyribodipyrimidine photo-lyase [Quercus suber]|uniref:Deoxyribodipyrimidine photo-lyase n=1 Tax=Quercus suber TaxID=58331 RepID=A0AAW0KHV1_QUESU
MTFWAVDRRTGGDHEFMGLRAEEDHHPSSVVGSESTILFQQNSLSSTFLRYMTGKLLLKLDTVKFIAANHTYEIDGRDLSGYVGCMWSICGIHDQGWRERPIFGKICYMNYAVCKRKFDVDGYISYVKRLVAEIKIKKRKSESLLSQKAKELRSS